MPSQFRARLRRAALPAVFLAGAVAGTLACSWWGRGEGGALALVSSQAQASEPAKEAKPGHTIPEVVRLASPAVVSVGAVKNTVYYESYDDFFAPFMVRPRRMRERVPFMGSGFLIDREGHILTNFHVIDGSESIFVTFTDGREVPAKVLDADRFTDVVLLKVEVPADELPQPLELGDSDTLEIGETAIAFGNPFGNLIEDPRPSVTTGVVSALHRTFRPDRANMRVYQDMIQTDAAINPGNSGGPLVDGAGRAIGINTFIVSRGGGSNGLGFAIPISRVKSFINEIKQYGRLRPLRLDFAAMTLNTPRVQGVVITDVAAEGPAISAGLEIGDVILAVDGRSIRTREDLMLVIASKQVGENLGMKVWRGGATRDVQYAISAAEPGK